MTAITDDPRSRRRTEDRRFLTGAGRYIDDHAEAGALHAAFVRSPHAHAHLGPIETADALALQGVHAVFTAADMARAGAGPIPCAMVLPATDGLIVPPRHPLASGTVRHVGEPVAMVVADTPLLARDAAERVQVDYDPLPSVTGMAEALASGAPLLWPQAPGNAAYRFRRGDPEAVAAAFARAAHVVELDLVNNRVTAAAMETRGVLARHDAATGRLHLLLSGQGVHGIRRDLAASLGLPLAMIHVACPDVGGGFGMKNVVHPEYVALLVAARRLGRALRWVADRTEDFTSGVHGRDNLTTARLALDADGRFLALDVATRANLGAYVSSLGPTAQTTAPSTAMGGLYAIPCVAMDVRGVFTNTVPLDAYRGAGKPESNYIIERLIDAAAHALQRDRVALRRLNLIGTFPYTSALGIGIDTGQFHEGLEAALHAADHAGFAARKAEAAARGKLLGLGIACFLETSRGQPTEDGAVRFRPDGTADLLIGTQSNGQGLETSFAQLAAARLGLPVEAFRLVQADSDRITVGGGHGGARSLVMAGTALRMAIDAALEKAAAEAARLLQRERSDLRFDAGTFHAEGGASIALADMLRILPPGALDADAHNPADQFVFPNGAHVAEVEVDPETGLVALRRYVAVDDYGVLVNPLLTEGQVQGGIAQGIGQALMESIHYDPDSGQLLTASFADYAIPRAADLPWLALSFNEHPTSRNILGAKGAGQAGAIAAPQTIINAIADAIGIPHIDMPATPERVWRACRSRPA
jgi:carbon-monoxide dehydrogenase large subunit